MKAPYYRKAWGDRHRGLRSVDQLGRLPLLDKLTAIRHQAGLVVGTPPPGFGVASSGTTRTDVDLPLLNVFRSEPDLEAADDDSDGWVLVSVSVNHGLPGQPGPNELFVPWMYDRNSLAMLESVLSRRQPDGRRITTMRISAGALKVFTAWMLERGKEKTCRGFGVELIGTNSFRVSPFWRRLISETFGGAVLLDNYSLSELEPCATECPSCGWHHWYGPEFIWETLDLETGTQRSDGVGQLVVTTLLPSAGVMPLIRYDTGDVIELGPRCRAERARGFRFLGRRRRGLVHGSDYLLAPTIVQDVLEGSPETARTDHPCVKLGFIKSREVGLPRWSVALENGVAHLRFEVRFDPSIYSERARSLEETLGGEVLHLDRRLRSLVKSKRLEFEVTAVRSLSLTPPPDKHD